MRVDKVVMGSTTHGFYLDFWPIVSKIWSQKFNIEPVLYLIHDDESVKASEEFGKVVYLKPVPKVPLNVQSQWCRYWAPQFEPDKVWMISDIDMIPISKSYFIDSIQNIPDDKFINLNAETIGEFPACYNIAKGSVFKEVLELSEDFGVSLENTEYWLRGGMHRPCDEITGYNWTTDESYSNEKIKAYDKKHSNKFIIPRRPGGWCARRLDRSKWRWSDDKLILDGFLLDAHCPRPYKEHNESIDKLVTLVLRGIR